MPEARSDEASTTGSSTRTSTSGQPTPWVSTSSPYWWPLLLSGSTVPVRKRPESVKIVTCAPSAKRALCVPSGVTSSRPESLSRVTMQPIVSACTTTARSGRAAPSGQGGVQQAAPGDRQVEAEVHQQLPTYCTTSSVRPSGSASGAGG
jgi:hypothetical protein